MAAPAIRKIVAAESSFVVMTTGAALRVFPREMHCRDRRADLIAARCARVYFVTNRAVELVTRVSKRRRGISSRPFRNVADDLSRLMTRRARIDIFLAAFCARRMACETRVVRVQARRDRERDAVSRRLMTRRAAGLPQMFRVVEHDVKALQNGKRFYNSGLRIRVTNRADRAFVVRKLLNVTARARQMTGQLRRRRIVFSLVTERARKTRVFRVRMFKFRKIGVRIYHRDRRKFRIVCRRRFGRNYFDFIFRLRARAEKIPESETSGDQNDKLAPATRGH